MNKSNIFQHDMAKNRKISTIPVLKVGFYCGEYGFPLNIQRREYPQSADQWHEHRDFAELVIVLGGSARNNMEGTAFPLQGGDIVYFPPHSRHHYSFIRKFHHYTILFQPEQLSGLPVSLSELPNYKSLFVSGDTCSAVMHLGEKVLSVTIGLLEDIRKEQLSRSSGWKAAMFIGFCKALIYLLRHAAPTGAAEKGALYQIGRAIRHMEENASRPFSLSELSAYAKMSESSFRHHFRELTGLAPIEYLIRSRLRRAALMLLYSDRSITEIALDAGFSDSSYFTRQFKTQFHCVPRKFRAAAQSGKIDRKEEWNTIFDPPNSSIP